MRWSSLTGAAVVVLTSAACGSTVETHADVNPAMSASIGTWRTYAFMPATNTGDARIYNDITRERVENAVTRNLSARGYTLDQENPDFLIAWHGSIDQRIEVGDLVGRYGYGWGWYGPGYATYVDSYDEGTLILDFVDRAQNELAWRGVAQGRLGRSPAQPSQGDIDEAVEEILEEFTPR